MFALCLLAWLGFGEIWAQKTLQSFPLRRAYILPTHKFGQKWLNAEINIGAGLGYKTDIAGGFVQIGHRFRKYPLWTLSAEANFWTISASANFPNTHFENKQHQLLPFLARADWHGGRRILYGAGLGAGLGMVFGFEKQWMHPDQSLYIYTAPAVLLVACLRLGGFIGYRCSKRWSLRLNADYTYASRQHTSNLRIYPPSQNSNPSMYKVLDTYRLNFWAFSFSVRVRLYKSLYPHTRTKEGIIYH